MKADSWQRELNVALDAVRQAVLLAREIRQRIDTPAFLKPDRSPVTVADFAVQACVAHRLSRAFPEDSLVAEEDATALRRPEGQAILQVVVDMVRGVAAGLDSKAVLDAIDLGGGAPGNRFWTLDPIDGTQGFLRGDHYVVALALVVGGRVEIGLLGYPEQSFIDASRSQVGSVIWAVRNRGAFGASLARHESVPLRVSACREASRARVLRSFEAEHIDLHAFNEIIQMLGVEATPTLMDSQAKHGIIAAGRADVLIRTPAIQDFRDKIWDQAAGTLIIEEAGGRVTDLEGASLDFGAGRTLSRNRGVIATNGDLHPAVLGAVSRVMSL